MGKLPDTITVRPDYDTSRRVIGHIITDGKVNLYCYTTGEVQAWLDAAGYILREEVAQLYNDGVHGSYRLSKGAVIPAEERTRPHFTRRIPAWPPSDDALSQHYRTWLSGLFARLRAKW